MFGHHKRQRERKRIKREKASLANERSMWEAQQPERDRATREANEKQLEQDVGAATKRRREAELAGREDLKQFLGQDVQGLSNKQRQIMQYEANKRVQDAYHQENRRLQGEQSRHGLVGKGGVAYSQQRNLQKIGQEARGQAARDLHKLDADLALKKLAAIFTGGKGEAAQSQLDRQTAQDQLELADEKKRLRDWEYQMRKNNVFGRV
jgi:hypothetical protein